MTSPAIVVSLATIEAVQLAHILDDFIELIGGSRDVDDPAVLRLTPTPYPDDDAASAAFAESTRDDLLDRRLLDARTMRAALGPHDQSVDALTEQEALTTQDLVVPTHELDSWLRTLTAVRLVVATRLGITSDEPTAQDSRHAVYDWLGYRLELLIQAADDADSGRSR